MLRAQISAGKIVCYFSGIHLSEMAPVESQHTNLAVKRAEILVELCGRNCMISFDRIIAAELRSACLGATDSPYPYSGDGEWYPENFSDVLPEVRPSITKSLQSSIREMAPNRRFRRQANALTLRSGGLRGKARDALIRSSRSASNDEILAKYPMRSEDARVLRRYIVGDTSRDDAQNAFLNSLRDPNWMMQWFSEHHETLNPFIEWARAPSRSMFQAFSRLAESAAEIAGLDRELGLSHLNEITSSHNWREWQDEVVVSLARHLAKSQIDNDGTSITAAIIDSRCRGISTAIRSLHSALRDSAQRHARTPKESDFIDAMHSIYAPYVDIFRTDSFMAQHVKAAGGCANTIVVPKLGALPEVITKALT